MNEPTKDDIYAYALSKTLTQISAPATVGLYSSCQNRINMILKQMEVYMKQEDKKPSFSGFLSLVGRLLFYRPIWTLKNLQDHDTRFIYVHFSAWHFAGSDLLWAGLVIRLIQAMQLNFGKLQLVLYRVAQHDEKEEMKKKILQGGPNRWQSKKICCCPLWFLAVSILVVPVAILVLLFTFGLHELDMKPDQTENRMGVLVGLAVALLGTPTVSALKIAFPIIKNLIFSLDRDIKKGMDDKQVSSQLGFMNEVKKEMWFLSGFMQFMEVFEGRRIRVVLKITHLDRCSPKKIVAVLDAINILLSDEESPFISVLGVNPVVLVQKVNSADCCFSKEDRAYALLNRIVTLAFTVPPLCDDSKHSLFNSLASNSNIPEDKGTRKDKNRTESLEMVSSSDPYYMERTYEMNEGIPLNSNKTKAALNVMEEEEVDVLVRRILISSEKKLNKYLFDDTMSMRRVINAIQVTVIILMALKKELPEPEFIAAWVVLSTQWPCRLSWVIQCVEDAQQRAEIDGECVTSDHSKTLWKVFGESRAELYVMSSQIEDFLEQDGDPEMFERFLTQDFQFTIKDLKLFEVAMVNLDHTIRKELAQIRGTSRLKDSGWMRNLAPLPITSIINMDTEDVCKELERMKYPSKYIDIVKHNDLSGSALVFGKIDDIKHLLGMTFGEWTTFRLHFLGLPSHLQPQSKNKPLLSHSQKQMSRFPLHVTHQYSSYPCLGNISR